MHDTIDAQGRKKTLRSLLKFLNVVSTASEAVILEAYEKINFE